MCVGRKYGVYGYPLSSYARFDRAWFYPSAILNHPIRTVAVQLVCEVLTTGILCLGYIVFQLIFNLHRKIVNKWTRRKRSGQVPTK